MSNYTHEEIKEMLDNSQIKPVTISSEGIAIFDDHSGVIKFHVAAPAIVKQLLEEIQELKDALEECEEYSIRHSDCE